jgi:hypothetical protein
MSETEAKAALDRIERKADMLRLEAKMRNRPNMVQHMEEITQLVKIVRRNQNATD